MSASFVELTAPLLELSIAGTALALWQVIVVALATLGSIAAYNRLAARVGLVDLPDNSRKLHGGVVPLTGGFAILTGLLVGLLVTDVPATSYAVLGLLALVVLLHAVDDLWGISPRFRLVVDMLIALAFIFLVGGTIETMGRLGQIELQLGLLAVPMTVLSYLTLSNAFNMIDGADGLMLSQFLVSVFGLVVWYSVSTGGGDIDAMIAIVAVAALVVLAANCGLLGRDMKCFSGDSGSRLLGFFLVFAMISVGPSVLNQIQGVYLVALPLLDICAVTVGRLRAGQSPVSPDRRHLHHLLIDAGLSRAATVAAMTGISAGFCLLLIWQEIAGWDDSASFLAFMLLATIYWSGRRRAVALVSGRLRPSQYLGPAE